jgi:hypothetical protein
MSKHTPGPWNTLKDSTGKYIAVHAEAKVICPVKIKDSADARLISAAPDLLEVLKRLLAHTESCRCNMVMGDDCPHYDGTRFTAGADSAIGEIIAAIRKAEGDE